MVLKSVVKHMYKVLIMQKNVFGTIFLITFFFLNEKHNCESSMSMYF